MARWRLVLIVDGMQVRLSYGYSRHLGFFLEIRNHSAAGCWSQVVDYSLLDDNYQGLPGLLNALVDSGVFSRSVVEGALEALLVVDDPLDIYEADVRSIATLVYNVKMAAGE